MPINDKYIQFRIWQISITCTVICATNFRNFSCSTPTDLGFHGVSNKYSDKMALSDADVQKQVSKSRKNHTICIEWEKLLWENCAKITIGKMFEFWCDTHGERISQLREVMGFPLWLCIISCHVNDVLEQIYILWFLLNIMWIN